MKLRNVGNPLLPTYASASIFKFSNLTSIVGKSIPTLQIFHHKKDQKSIFNHLNLQIKKTHFIHNFELQS